MTFRFHIPYIAAPGEHLRLEWNDGVHAPVILVPEDAENWTGEARLDDVKPGATLAYRYSVWRVDRRVRRESGPAPHRLRVFETPGAAYDVFDAWRDYPREQAYFAMPFSQEEEIPPTVKSDSYATLTFRVLAPSLSASGCRLALLGASPALGQWQPDRALLFEALAPGVWQLTVDAAQLRDGTEYKYVAVDVENGEIRAWSEGDNRRLFLPANAPDHRVLPEAEIYFSELLPRWAGTAIPVFSLRTDGSQGVGDFGDLRAMIDWVAETGQRVLQLLPVHDTTQGGADGDSYPYNAISVYAFHPMYVDLRALPSLADRTLQNTFEREWRELNALPAIDYARVNKLKRDFLLLSFREQGRAVLSGADYRAFAERAASWLDAYAAFSALRDKYGTPDFSAWPAHRVYDVVAVRRTCAPGSPEGEQADFYRYVQYLLHVQLSAAAEHARRRGVALKGDIPIGISRCSVEAWTEPHCFNLSGSAGAPPDAFSVIGQNWGFPTYNWDAMAADGYAWWKRRYAQMADYFSAYRVDHILGFFRIWEIPVHSVRGLLGRFVPALPLTPDEIEAFGLPFRKDFLTRPFISDTWLDRLFGARADWVKQHFLTHAYYDIWHLRPEFSTQRAIVARLESEYSREPDIDALRDALFALTENVLFIEDPRERDRYHPRIAGFQTFVFERLTAEERAAFERIHEHFYYHRHNAFWHDSAMAKLPALCTATAMLPCGEDLGMVPDCVAPVMDALQLLSLEIERMPKAFGREFGDVAHYPVRSVATTGTHDMSTLRGWWHEDPARSARYFLEVLGHGGLAPTGDAPAWLCEEVVRRHLESPSMLCILPWQDWLSLDEHLRLPDADAERINVPADPHHIWRYRMHLSLDVLLRREDFNARLRTLIGDARRG